MIICLVLILILAALYLFSWMHQPEPASPFFTSLPQDRPLVIAHRGGARLFPENTLTAFHAAAALGVDAFEMDIHLTSDGVPVVIHDDTVDRTTNGSGPVRNHLLADLQQLDAGYQFTPEDAPGTFPFRDQGIRIPTLREVFESFPDMHMIIELKEADADATQAVMALILEFNRVDRTLAASFHHSVLTRFRNLVPEIATHASHSEAGRFLKASWIGLAGLISPDYEALIVPQRSGSTPVTTRRFIRAARKRNLFVGAWTINDSNDMQKLIDRGVHALITDRPDLALGLIQTQ